MAFTWTQPQQSTRQTIAVCWKANLQDVHAEKHPCMLKSTHVCWKALMYAEKHSFISLPICWGPLWETCTDRSKPNTFNIVKRADARVPVVCLGDGCIFFWAQQRINSFKRKKWVEVGPQPDWVTEQAKLHSQVKKKQTASYLPAHVLRSDWHYGSNNATLSLWHPSQT